MITQLQAEYLSRFNGRYTTRKLELLKARAHKLTKAKIRKTRSMYLSWHRQQYFLATAYTEMRQAVRRNEDIFISVTVLAIALGYAYATIAAELAYRFFITAFIFSEISGANMLIIGMVAACLLSVTLAWATAFILNAMSIAIMHGANRKQVRSVRATMRQGLQYVGRTVVSWLALLAAIALPVLAVGILGLIHFLLYVTTPAQALEILPYYTIAAIAAAVYVLLQFSLVPLVTLFEPGLSYRAAFKRSRELVSRKGKVFVLAGYGTLAVALAAEYALSLALQDLTGFSKDLAFSLMAIATAVYAHSIMTIFYRKRRLARNR